MRFQGRGQPINPPRMWWGVPGTRATIHTIRPCWSTASSAARAPRRRRATCVLAGSGHDLHAGDAVGVYPSNRAEAVAEVLTALGFTGQERVLDHYKVEISFGEALRTRLAIGKLAAAASASMPSCLRRRRRRRGYDALSALRAGEQGACRGVLLGPRVHRPHH